MISLSLDEACFKKCKFGVPEFDLETVFIISNKSYKINSDNQKPTRLVGLHPLCNLIFTQLEKIIRKNHGHLQPTPKKGFQTGCRNSLSRLFIETSMFSLTKLETS